MSKAAAFAVKNLFSPASRERCMENLKRAQVIPPGGRLRPSRLSTQDPRENSAAVLIPLCSIDDSVSLLYTLRSKNLKTHSGQISFPGGKMNTGESAVQTALRETREEIGLASGKVDIWGHGPPIPGRGREMIITPVVGTVSNLTVNDLNINAKEVTEAFAVPLQILCNPNNQFYTQFSNGYILPVFVAEDYKIWGITAFLTHVFLNSLLPTELYTNEWTRKKITIEE